MSGKAKPTKHTAKEIAGKHHAAKMRAGGTGGGLDGKAKRIAPKEGKKDIFIKCVKCFTMQPSMKSMSIHYENKHPKEDWAAAEKMYAAENKEETDSSEKNNYNQFNNYDDNEDNYENEEENYNEDGIEEEQKEGN